MITAVLAFVLAAGESTALALGLTELATMIVAAYPIIMRAFILFASMDMFKYSVNSAYTSIFGGISITPLAMVFFGIVVLFNILYITKGKVKKVVRRVKKRF